MLFHEEKSVGSTLYSQVITQLFFIGAALIVQHVEVLLSISHFIPQNNCTHYWKDVAWNVELIQSIIYCSIKDILNFFFFFWTFLIETNVFHPLQVQRKE